MELAKSSLKLSQQAAVTTVKTSGKAAYYLIRPKAIKEQEIWGVWRLDQQIGIKQSTANIELTPQGHVILRQGNNNIVWKGPYTFIAPTWPLSCRIEFEARAFQDKTTTSNNSKDQSKPVLLLFYKGYLERKVANPSIIKMVGTLYDIERRKSILGRKDLPVKYHKIGSFVGRRRVVLQQDDDEDDDDDEEQEEEDDDYSDKEDQVGEEEEGQDSQETNNSSSNVDSDEDDEYDFEDEL